MKKISFLCIALVMISFTACIKKDRTCTCTDSSGVSDKFTITKATKKQAQAKCISYTETVNNTAYTRNCTLSN